MPNLLAGETSPYLLQHANNPVDWMPWSGDALARAKLLDRPIFLSIGYAACHWCHVMERESFEDEATAKVLNDHFVSIKVDREERPDLDSIYMSAVQAMTGGGGWPMSVFLTPDGQPFYGGTYYPDQPRHGMPSFRQVLEGVSEAWRTQRGQVLDAGQRLVSALVEQARNASGGGEAVIDREFFHAVNAALDAGFDARNGSWGGAPKFPQPMTLEYMLRRMAAGDRAPGAMVRFTLDKMADGGIRDQLGGGFHRYATDARWLVPHFEQMLYDNAQLARVYLHASRQFGEDSGGAQYREVATGVLEYMLRELRREDGAFAASQDADTEGEEGRTFTWSASEIREVLGEGEAAAAFERAYGVTPDGNWEGVTILSRVWDASNEPPPARRPFAGGIVGRVPRGVAGTTRDPTAAGARRQGARGLERAGDRGLRRGRPAAPGGAVHGRGHGGRRDDRRRAAGRRWLAEAVVEGRSRRRGGGARGLQPSRRGLAGSVRDDL